MAKMTEAELIERDAKRDIGVEVPEAIREIKALGGRKFAVKISEPDPVSGLAGGTRC